jgi:2-oxoisovalerate dehydrogenase E1 component
VSNDSAIEHMQDVCIAGLSKQEWIDLYRMMLLSRRIDEKQEMLFKQGKVFFHVGGSGHEAAQIAAAKTLRPGYDWAFPYYRDQAFVLQYGMTPEEIFLAAMHRGDDPASGARQMPGHFGKRDLHIVSQSSPTGTQFLQAVGVALAINKEKGHEVVYVSSGEGATSEGEFFEALNWASREALPVIFFVQDNKLAISVPVTTQTAGGSVSEVARGFKGLECIQCDGTDVAETYLRMQEAVKRAREKKGPSLIQAHVVRLLPHSSSDDPRKYRRPEDIDKDIQCDPLPRLKRFLLEQKFLNDHEAGILKDEVKCTVDAAVEWAEHQPLPDPSTVMLHLYGDAHTKSPLEFNEPVHTGPKVVMVDAINHALNEEMDNNPKAVIFGQDVADGKGGVFTATKGLLTNFGSERTFNSPLAEASIVGIAIGMSLKGWTPIPEIQFGDYIWPAFMQIRDELGMMRYRSHGTWSCPMVIRVPVGGYIHGGLYHSQCIEGFMAHIPGIRLAFPSTAADAKGLLKSAIHGDDPVLFMEHKGLYRQGYASTLEPDAGYMLPFGVAALRREGNDVTVVTYGAMVHLSLEVARILESNNISVEVIDLRTLNPLDEEAVYRSVRKTNRVAVIHEDTLTGGFGAEIVALIAKNCFEYLDAPVVRVAALDTPIPYSPPLEDAVLPNKQKILTALKQLAEY